MKFFTDKCCLPPPTLERLARLYTLLGRLEEAQTRRVTSRALEGLLSVPCHTIRKDISLLGAAAKAERGYDVAALRQTLGLRLGLSAGYSVCLVGLGRLGGAILNQAGADRRYPLAAAFDASMNRIELTRTDVPLYHSTQISRVVREKAITAGIITVPPHAAWEAAERLIAGGARGIVNFSPVIITAADKPVVVRNISLTGELDVIAAYIHMQGV
ncbi:MAG: redox-sensing transcriptional repressor Rex [Spirochaetales bacterium]|nr:redox-sensing transcriptional repressor Rex [Spirochaetales bacterium]